MPSSRIAVAGAGTGMMPCAARTQPAPTPTGRLIDPHDAEALEPLDPTDDVHQGVHRAHLVEGDLVRRHAVDPPLGLAQQGEGTHRTLAHPA